MSHSVVVLFLLAMVGIYTINGQVCGSGELGLCVTNDIDYDKCDTLETEAPPCKGKNRKCCVDCKNLQETCFGTYNHSVARGPTNVALLHSPPETQPCAPKELVVFNPFPESGCKCCQRCYRNRRCRDHKKTGTKSRCVTEFDPVYNWAWCEERGGTITSHCHPYGCDCCWRYTPE